MALCPICPRCELRGLHGTAEECLVALRKAVTIARAHYLDVQKFRRYPERNRPDDPSPTRSP